MSDDQQQQEPQNNEGDTGGIAQLRQQYEAMKQELAAERAKAQGLEAVQRTSALDSVLGELKVRPALARFYPADAETSKEAVEKWARENAEAFGLTFDDTTPEAQAQTEQVAAAQRQQQAAQANTGKDPLQVGTQEERDQLIADNDPVWLMEQGLIPDIRPFA